MNRNALYLQATMTTLGLSRTSVAHLCEVSPRTVANWLDGRNTVPGTVWNRIARVRDRMASYVAGVLAAWEAGDKPKVFDVTVPSWPKLPGPALVAAWEVCEHLQAARVYVTLHRTPL